MLHALQKKILLRLAQKNNQKYSELQIDGIENDLFNYHLQHLVKSEFVNKSNDGYSITEKGIESILLVDSTGKQYTGIRASVLVYVIDNRLNELNTLCQKRIRKPYIGDRNAGISGKIIPGESVKNAAERKLKEETGLEGECKFVGTLRKTRISQDGMLDDAFFYVCVCEKWTGELLSKTEYGENFWASTKEALQAQKELKSSGGVSYKILNNILSGDHSIFFEEEIVQIDSF